MLLGSFRAISGDDEKLAALEVDVEAFPPGRRVEVGRHEDGAFQTWLRHHDEYGGE